MIFPQPEADLSLNTLIVGSDIIKLLKHCKDYLIIEDILKKFMFLDKKRSHALFFDTVTFLYALGIIKEENYKIRLTNDNHP
jgi:hypothetical protein